MRNSARTLPVNGIKPPGTSRILSKTGPSTAKKVEFARSTIVRNDQKRPGTALSVVEEKKPETTAERIQKVEKSLSSALEQAESQLSTLTSELEFSQELVDEATEYCDRLHTYKELFNYYEEIKHLSEKLKDKRRSLQYSKEEYLKNVHDYSHFLSDSLSSFRDFMVLRKKKIDENIKLAEQEEKENMRQNPPLYKRDVEMREQAVQVRRESLIYYSPNAGVLRSTARQRVEMPALPVLKTDFDVSMTPSYSAYPMSARRRNEMPALPVLKTNFDMNTTPTHSARKRNEKLID